LDPDTVIQYRVTADNIVKSHLACCMCHVQYGVHDNFLPWLPMFDALYTRRNILFSLHDNITVRTIYV
jgi:hypothetical protein